MPFFLGHEPEAKQVMGKYQFQKELLVILFFYNVILSCRQSSVCVREHRYDDELPKLKA